MAPAPPCPTGKPLRAEHLSPPFRAGVDLHATHDMVHHSSGDFALLHSGRHTLVFGRRTRVLDPCGTCGTLVLDRRSVRGAPGSFSQAGRRGFLFKRAREHPRRGTRLGSWWLPVRIATVRNPMISGVLLMLIAETLFSGSWPLLGWVVAFFLINTAYFFTIEEPGLERRFGEDYRHYRSNVPRWIPRWRPWNDS